MVLLVTVQYKLVAKIHMAEGAGDGRGVAMASHVTFKRIGRLQLVKAGRTLEVGRALRAEMI